MLNNWMNYVKRVREEEDGITALETAIILIAFVVVASVFAFTMLSAGTFSTERGREAIYAGLSEVQSSMDVKGSVIALAAEEGMSSTVTSLIFTVSNALGGEPVNLGNQSDVIFEYRDSTQRIVFEPEDWEVGWLGNANDNGLLETGELAEITIDLTDLAEADNPQLGVNTTFVLEIKPPRGAVLSLQRTTPAWLEEVNDLN